MTPLQIKQFNKMYDALLCIAVEYDEAQAILDGSQSYCGLDSDEALQMAYENMQTEAKMAIKDIERIEVSGKLPPPPEIAPKKTVTDW